MSSGIVLHRVVLQKHRVNLVNDVVGDVNDDEVGDVNGDVDDVNGDGNFNDDGKLFSAGREGS